MSLTLPEKLRLLASQQPSNADTLTTAAELLERMARQIELNRQLDEDDHK